MQLWSLPSNDSMSNDYSNKFDLFTSRWPIQPTFYTISNGTRSLFYFSPYQWISLTVFAVSFIRYFSTLITRLARYHPASTLLAFLLVSVCLVRVAMRTWCTSMLVNWINSFVECFFLLFQRIQRSSGEKWRTMAVWYIHAERWIWSRNIYRCETLVSTIKPATKLSLLQLIKPENSVWRCIEFTSNHPSNEWRREERLEVSCGKQNAP